MGVMAHNRTPVKSERTALVCWGPKGKMKEKGALYRGSQANECLMTHTYATRSWQGVICHTFVELSLL